MFTVRWTRSARLGLGDIWVRADLDLRKTITTAANKIERGLRRKPQNKGESRSGATRIWFVFPLCILFEVDEERSRVRVYNVRSYTRDE
jgi:hypothetical protein